MSRAREGARSWIEPVAMTTAFAIVAAVGLWRHEMWRDEYQAWLVARDAASIPQLFSNLKYEGNPGLWHLLLYGLTRFTADPRAMQVLNFVIAVAGVAVISWRAPFSRAWKLLLIFGYGTLFEYTLKSRSYALGLLLVLMACVWYPTRHRRPWRLAIVLALLANTHLFGLAIALSLAGLAVLERDEESTGFSQRLFTWQSAGFSLIVAAGILVSLIQIWPEANNTFPLSKPQPGFDARRAVEALGQLANAYVPIPRAWLPQYWNTDIFEVVRAPGLGITPTRVEAAVAVAFLLVFSWHFRRRPLLAGAYLAGSAMLVAVFYRSGHYSQRYIAHFFILLVAAMWLFELGRLRRALRDARGSSGADRLGAVVFTVVLICGTIAGAIAWTKDVRSPFTRNREVARFLQSEHLDRDEIIGIEDFAMSPLAAQLNRRVYFPQMRGDGSFAIWSDKRQDHLEPGDLLAQIASVVRRGGRHRAVLVLNNPVIEFLPEMNVSESDGRRALAPGLTIQLVKHVPVAVVIGEQYFVYLVEEEVRGQK